MTNRDVFDVADAPTDVSALVERVHRDRAPAFLAADDEVRAVLMGIEEYHALIERLGDFEDSLAILEARAANEPSRPFDAFVAELESVPPTDVRRHA